MSQQLLIIVGIALLALGTYSIRFAGFHLGAKFSFSEKYQVLLSNGATVLLCAIAVTTTFFEGHHFAGFARMIWGGFGTFLSLEKSTAFIGDLSGSGWHSTGTFTWN